LSVNTTPQQLYRLPTRQTYFLLHFRNIINDYRELNLNNPIHIELEALRAVALKLEDINAQIAIWRALKVIITSGFFLFGHFCGDMRIKQVIS
jgi:hypothetical protein